MNFEQFKQVAKNPREQLELYLNRGKKVIGCFPLYIPEQIIYAAGMVPFGMWGAEIEVKAAKNYFPPYICGILQTNLELAMAGSYKGLSAVIITTLCDSLKCATQNWKYAIPDIEMISLTHPQNRDSGGAFLFLYEQYKQLIEKMELISGQKITDQKLREAINIYNGHNEIMRCFLNMVETYPKEISPLERSYVIKSAYFMDKKEHTELVKQVMKELGDITPKSFRGTRVVTTGIIADNEELLTILQENNITVVADDIAHESRQIRLDVIHEEDEISALAKQYLGMYACSTVIGGNISREEYLVNLVRQTNADGVILLMTKFCDPEEYDYPCMKEKLDENNIPLLLIEVDKQIENYGQARTAVQTFREMIRL